jgi:hypothetical protein
MTEGVEVEENVSNEALMLDLLTAFTPELSVDDVMERLIKVTREVFCVQRASVFIVDEKVREGREDVKRSVITSIIKANSNLSPLVAGQPACP